MIETFCKAFSEWSGEGQGIFLLLALGITTECIVRSLEFIAIIFRGYPQ